MKNIKKLYKNNKFKISASTWKEEFEKPDRSYFVSDIQGYFEYILKNDGEETVNSSIKKYVNKTENGITFKIKTGYYLEHIAPETKKLLGSIKIKTTKSKNSENVPNLQITDLVQCNIVDKKYQRSLRVIYASVSNKLFGQLLSISPKDFIFLETFHSQFSYIEVCFTDQNSNSLEIEDNR